MNWSGAFAPPPPAELLYTIPRQLPHTTPQLLPHTIPQQLPHTTNPPPPQLLPHTIPQQLLWLWYSQHWHSHAEDWQPLGTAGYTLWWALEHKDLTADIQFLPHPLWSFDTSKNSWWKSILLSWAHLSMMLKTNTIFTTFLKKHSLWTITSGCHILFVVYYVFKTSIFTLNWPSTYCPYQSKGTQPHNKKSIVATCALNALSKAHALHALFDHPRTEGNVRYSIFVESISYFCPEG